MPKLRPSETRTILKDILKNYAPEDILELAMTAVSNSYSSSALRGWGPKGNSYREKLTKQVDWFLLSCADYDAKYPEDAKTSNN